MNNHLFKTGVYTIGRRIVESLVVVVVVVLVVGAYFLLLPRDAKILPPSGASSESRETAQVVATTVISTAAVTTTITTVKATTTTATVITSTPPQENGKVLISVEILCQFPEYPTGCEAVAAVMALRHAGEYTSVANFIDNYLPCSTDFYWYDGRFYGPSPNDYFLGNPRTNSSYGCMAPVIRKALTRFFGTETRVTDVTGQSLPVLCERYIDHGYPVMVWASINMLAIKDGRQWVLPSGDTFTWPSNEHCMLLVGYDAQSYYFNDPYTGRVMSYRRALAESRYEQMGKQALVIQ